MTRRTSKKTVEPSPAEPPKEVAAAYKLKPHEEEALAHYKARTATAPPAVSLTVKENGVHAVDVKHPDRAAGIVSLMASTGTTDADFFSTYLTQVMNAANKGKPNDGDINAALAFIRGVQPRDEVEAALAAQMMATHNAVMAFARRLNHVENIPQQDSAINAYNKLARTYAVQMETLKRYRATGEQKVTVQHIAVSEGSQAIIGNVTTGGGGKQNERE